MILPHQFLPDELAGLFEIETKRYLADYNIKVLEAKVASSPDDKEALSQLEEAKKSLPPGLTSEQEATRDVRFKKGGRKIYIFMSFVSEIAGQRFS